MCTPLTMLTNYRTFDERESPADNSPRRPPRAPRNGSFGVPQPLTYSQQVCVAVFFSFASILELIRLLDFSSPEHFRVNSFTERVRMLLLLAIVLEDWIGVLYPSHVLLAFCISSAYHYQNHLVAYPEAQFRWQCAPNNLRTHTLASD